MQRQHALTTVLRLGAVAVLACLLLPWFGGEDDGRPLHVAGWDTEPGFTVGMIALGLVLLATPRPKPAGVRRWLPLAATVLMIALTIWMLPRGDRYSAPDLLAGAYVALAFEAALLAAAVAYSRGT
jgi:hypothetical protein